MPALKQILVAAAIAFLVIAIANRVAPLRTWLATDAPPAA